MVPPSLRRWFVVHFVVDLLFAVPLLAAPELLLGWLGWIAVDPVAARLVGAALVGIGVQSWRGRHEGREVFRAMLDLKLLWSATATVGLLVSLLQGAPVATGLFAAVFAAFFCLWGSYRLRLR